MLQPVKDCPTELLEWTQKHVPISVSLCSNVEEYSDAICIVDENQYTLVEKMVNILKEIANRVFEAAEDKWGWVLEAIEEQLRQHDTGNKEFFGEETAEYDAVSGEKRHSLIELYGQFEGYMSQVPV